MGIKENKCQECGKVIPSGLLKCLSCSLNLMTKGNKAVWRCKVCGDKVEPNIEVCDTCGTHFCSEEEEEIANVEPQAETEFEVEYVCMICNHPVDRRARKCEFCGTVFFEKGETKCGPVVERVDRKRYSKASPSAG